MPSGEPVKELILQNVEAAMKLIDGTSNYYTTVNPAYVERGEIGAVEIKTFPHVIITPGPTEYDTEPRQTRVLRKRTGEFLIYIRLMIETRTNVALTIQRFIRDANFALNIDCTRGGNAMDSWLMTDEPWYPSGADDPIGGADLVLKVWYRTDLNNPNSVG